jgi:hypothetical protein
MTMADEGDRPAASGDSVSEQPSASAAPDPGDAAQAAADQAAQPEAEAEPATSGDSPPERESLVDAIADLLQMAVDWLRAEAADLMRDKVVLPLQQLGLTLSSAMAAGCLFVVGMLFLFVALLLVLAAWLGWPGALTLVGCVILLGAGIFTFVKMRSLQK